MMLPDEEAAVSGIQGGQQAPETCPVTRVTDPAFSPPGKEGVSVEGYFWYGSDRLWTSLPASGVWAELPRSERGYTQKIAWYSEGYSWLEEPQPELEVNGRRLDGNAPPLEAPSATNAYSEELGSAILTGVNIPGGGCWEITGEYKGERLSFVVWVEP